MENFSCHGEKLMVSEVFFVSARSQGQSLLAKLKELMKTLQLREIIREKDKVAVKVHMGAPGSTRFIRPIFVKEIVTIIKELKAHPFVTDTTTLYPGERSTPSGYRETACSHGFTEETLGCPIIIADDPNFPSKVLPTKGGQFSKIEVAGAIAEADSLIVVSHVKGHDLAGFGGSIKNVGMGCLTKEGKSKVHKATRPLLISDKCIGCGACAKTCPWNCITINDGKASLNENECKGCTSCLYSCPTSALYVPTEKKNEFQLMLASAASAVAAHFEEKMASVNFVLDVTPVCDCAPFSDIPIVVDVGILASRDIVAVDKLSLDLVNEADIYPGSVLHEKSNVKGKSKFQVLHGVDPYIQVFAAEKLSLGSTQAILKKSAQS
jgi:uncharacterized Fe-S center protein